MQKKHFFLAKVYTLPCNVVSGVLCTGAVISLVHVWDGHLKPKSPTLYIIIIMYMYLYNYTLWLLLNLQTQRTCNLHDTWYRCVVSYLSRGILLHKYIIFKLLWCLILCWQSEGNHLLLKPILTNYKLPSRTLLFPLAITVSPRPLPRWCSTATSTMREP